MKNVTRTFAKSFCSLIFFLTLINNLTAQAPKITLEQSANGSVEEPLSPPEWIKGHLGRSNSHYAPGSVIPYRAVVTNPPLNCPLQIRLSFLQIQNGKHATDFPTNYNQSTLEHIREFGSWEPVDPLASLSGNFTGPTSSDFPLVLNIFVPGDQSTNLSNYLYFLSTYGPQRLSAWNADLSNVQFVGFGDHNANDGGDRQLIFDVTFTATSSPVVFAWGGHIAYDTLNFNLGWGYVDGLTLGSGSSSAAGLTKCLSLVQVAASSGGGGTSFIGGAGEITYSISGGKPINPTTIDRTNVQEEQSTKDQKISVYPNPNKGNAIVVLPGNSNLADITLSDISGKIIKSWREYGNSTLELTSLQPGMYFLNVSFRESNNKTVLKVVVLK